MSDLDMLAHVLERVEIQALQVSKQDGTNVSLISDIDSHVLWVCSVHATDHSRQWTIDSRIFFITTILHNYLSHNILITERKGNSHYRIADANLAV